ncbi:MAG: asparagine synthase (glutamine-hydrolyzing) [Thermodesulfobacteriota bacterium]
MCGIAGFINAPASPEQQRQWIDSMAAALAHRGPDNHGTWVEGDVALGHRRLSIIDLQGGHQPLLDWDGRAVIVFNGEIYNFQEIRAGLERRGYRFRTNSDTEVLLNAYLEAGPDCLNSLEGMFAFAIWDKEKRVLFAARDRMGKKPFYYTRQNGVFAFASELTAFSRLPLLRLEVERESLARFLAHEYIPTPGSIYREVFKLRPGHYLTLASGQVATRRYWDIPLPEARNRLSEEDCCRQLRGLASRAVKRRLISDVPLGVLLSGGIDSSAVVGLMAEVVPAKEIKTFTIGFHEKSYDESPYARLVAQRFGTDHHEEILSATQAGELLPDIISRLDEPLADPSVVPTYLLSQVTRRRVTVALGGDGGDELFGGYEHFLGFLLADHYLRIPACLRQRVLEPLGSLLPTSTGYVSPRHVVERFIAGTRVAPWLRTQIWLGAFTRDMQEALWRVPAPEMLSLENLYAETRALYEGYPAAEPFSRVFYLFARQFLLDYILVKVDRCSMMHALEVRAPFLDTAVVEFVYQLPHWMKVRYGKRKYLLKKALKDLFPREILHRQKRGFLIPTSLWLKDLLRPLVNDFLGERRLRQQGLFKPEVVRGLLKEHDTGIADHRRELWTLLVLQLWLHHHGATVV